MIKPIFLFLVCFCLCLCIMPLIIHYTTKLKFGQNILGYVDKHKSKQGTPTMGGVIFLVGLLICYLFTLKSNNTGITIVLISTFAYGLIGFLDDYLKIKRKTNEGLKAYQKMIGQVVVALCISLCSYFALKNSFIVIPFSFKIVNIGVWIVPWVVFVFVAITNAVNLTDGLDGLSAGVSFYYLIFYFAIMVIFLPYLTNSNASVTSLNEYNQLLNLVGGFMGCLLAFLCFNSYPAKIFMGDTGSLAIGGFLSAILVQTKLYLYMPLLGIMFVIETLSVILQVSYYKLTHKRILKMAPLHHHFELSNINESKITYIYIVITIIVGLICVLCSII